MRLVKSRNGYGFIGRDGGKITAAAVIIMPEQQPVLAGSVSAGSSPTVKSSTVTGVGTAFNTALKVGDLVEFDTAVPTIARVKTITSATSMVISDPDDPDQNLSVYLPALTTYRKYTALWAGKTAPSGIEITTEEGVSETKSSDGGDKPENVFSNMVKPMIKFTLMEADLDVLSILLKGMVNITRDVNGKIVANSIGQRSGFDFKKNAIRIAVIEYAGSSISQDPKDRADFFKVGFKGNIKLVKNASDQEAIELEGYIFEDPSKRINGQAQFFAVNDAAMVYD